MSFNVVPRGKDGERKQKEGLSILWARLCEVHFSMASDLKSLVGVTHFRFPVPPQRSMPATTSHVPACTPPPNSVFGDFSLVSWKSAVSGAFTLRKWAQATNQSSARSSRPSRAQLPGHIITPTAEGTGAPRARAGPQPSGPLMPLPFSLRNDSSSSYMSF